MSIYTKKGDKGKTRLFSKSVWKDDPVVEVLGCIDELNSYLGVVIAESEDIKLKEFLKDTQRNLLTIGSILSGSKLRFSKTKTTKLEKIMDQLEKTLPPLKHFVLPGGCKTAANLHCARSLVRRVEREVVGLSKKERVQPQVLAYLNRLSDTLFILARDANYKRGVGDEVWERTGH